MQVHSSKNRTTKRHEAPDALTKAEHWDGRYAHKQVSELLALARQPNLIDEHLQGKTGRVFELGCGGSRFLARSALLGWSVGGIDFSDAGIHLIRGCLTECGADASNLVCDDVMSFDLTQLSHDYDLLVSFGFLEHFKNPGAIIGKWKCILNGNGTVVSAIPNLNSINARLLAKYDDEVWRQHVPFSPNDMDKFHSEAGLVPLKPAQYFGRYDLHMLVPWGKIAERISKPMAYRVLKLLASWCVEPTLRLFSGSNSRLFSPLVVGVYGLREHLSSD